MKPESKPTKKKSSSGTQPRSKHKYERQIAGLEKHLENFPNDSEARKRLNTARDRLRAL